MKILLVDDEKRASEAIAEFLGDDHQVAICEDGEQALHYLKEHQADLVITDHQMPKVTGLELIKEGKKLYKETFFIMVTAHGSLDHAVQALRSGADDYIVKPINFDELELRVGRVDQLIMWHNEKSLKQPLQPAVDKIIGRSEPIHQLKEFIGKVSNVETPVLITGESGSGKELVAKAIHENSERNKYPFIPINCASLSEQLLESELFGHEKGAFTGATTSKPGKFELARKGTLFLDEIGELDLGLQAKLLRVLQEKEFFRVGGTRLLKADCRIVAATHRPLEAMVKDGQFREDLFFRLNILRCETPRLNDRKEDIPLLVEHFWQELCQQVKCKIKYDDSLLAVLQKQTYVGNVRELRNTLERLIVLNQQKSMLTSADFVNSGPAVAAGTSSAGVLEVDYTRGLSAIVDSLEKQIVSQALADHDGNQVQTAKSLKITRGALQYKLTKYEIEIKKAG